MRNTVRNRTKPCGVSIDSSMAEMREYGFQAVDLAMKTLRQGLASNPVEVFFSRTWFRLCSMAAPLRRSVSQGQVSPGEGCPLITSACV